MKRFLVTLHRWLGFPLGVFFLVTFGTGLLTAVDELLSRKSSDLPYREVSLEEKAATLETLLANHEDVRQIVMPSEATPYYQVARRGERITYPLVDSLDIESQTQEQGGFFATVLQLHRNLLLGKEGIFGVSGAKIVAWVALLSLLLSLIGLWLWWPLRRTFKPAHLVPRSLARKAMYYNHMSSGVVVFVAIVLLALTGAGITYRDVAKRVLGVNEIQAQPHQNQPLPKQWHAWLNAAYQQMPGGELRYVRMPRQEPGKNGGGRAKGQERRAREQNRADTRSPERQNPGRSNSAENTVVELIFATPGDWWGLTNSRVAIDIKSSNIVKVELFENLDLGNKLYAVMVPLHTGRNLPAAYVVALLVFSLMGTVMVFTGVASFVLKKRRRPQWLKSRQNAQQQLGQNSQPTTSQAALE